MVTPLAGREFGVASVKVRLPTVTVALFVFVSPFAVWGYT
jgi:hypothetical protein